MKYNFIILFSWILLTGCFISSFTIGADKHPTPYMLSYPEDFGAPVIPAENPLTVEGVWLGRLLFYDPIVSANGKMACANCHAPKQFFSDGRPLAIGLFHDTLSRKTMPLNNLAWTKYFFWDGRDTSLEQAIFDHMSSPKLMGDIINGGLEKRLKLSKHYPDLFKQAFPNDSISVYTVSKALSQFTRTIVAKSSKEPDKMKGMDGTTQFERLLRENSYEGTKARMSSMHCRNCHSSERIGGERMAVYVDDSTYKAVTLINSLNHAPYMHNGRFKTLKEVFQFYNNNIDTLIKKNKNLIPSDGFTIMKFNNYDLEHIDEAFADLNDYSVKAGNDLSNPFKQLTFKWKGKNQIK